MKDKEKQIKSDCEKCIHDKVCYDCLMTDKCWGKDNDCKHYQPKLPEDSVVLSREEYEKYQNLKRDVEHSFEYNQGYADGQIKGSKETAEKILNEIYSLASRRDTINLLTRIKDIATREGVEIKD